LRDGSTPPPPSRRRTAPPPKRDKTETLALQLVAGGISGAVTKTLTAPLERVKLLLQLQGMTSAPKKYHGILHTLRATLEEEGLRGWFKGNGANVLRVVPVYALKFAFNDTFKNVFRVAGQPLTNAELMASGTLAGLFQQVVTYPLETIRTRLTLGPRMSKVQYRGITDAFRETLRSEGPTGLYKGLGPTILTGSPYVGLQMTMYEVLLKRMPKADGPFEREMYKLLSGAVAGIVAQTVTYVRRFAGLRRFGARRLTRRRAAGRHGPQAHADQRHVRRGALVPRLVALLAARRADGGVEDALRGALRQRGEGHSGRRHPVLGVRDVQGLVWGVTEEPPSEPAFGAELRRRSEGFMRRPVHANLVLPSPGVDTVARTSMDASRSPPRWRGGVQPCRGTPPIPTQERTSLARSRSLSCCVLAVSRVCLAHCATTSPLPELRSGSVRGCSPQPLSRSQTKQAALRRSPAAASCRQLPPVPPATASYRHPAPSPPTPRLQRDTTKPWRPTKPNPLGTPNCRTTTSTR